MTPKEKAKELVLKFIIVPDEAMSENSNAAWIDKILAKRCALIAVDEIINGNFGEGYNHQFWEEVKQEIQNL